MWYNIQNQRLFRVTHVHGAYLTFIEHEQCDATVEYRGNLGDARGTEWYAGNFV